MSNATPSMLQQPTPAAPMQVAPATQPPAQKPHGMSTGKILMITAGVIGTLLFLCCIAGNIGQ